MGNKEMLNIIHRVMRKENRGGAVTVVDFNRYLKQKTRERYDFNKDIMERDEKVTTAMERYVRQASVNATTGQFTFPTNYEKPLGAVALHNGTFSRKVDIVTQMEYDERKSNVLTQPSARNPIMYPINGVFKVEPSVSSIQFTYMVHPAEPFLDYYFDANRNVVYLDAGVSRVLGVGEVGKNGEVAGTTIVSQTVEVDMEESDKIVIMYSIMRLLGASIPNEPIYTLGSQEQMKSEQ